MTKLIKNECKKWILYTCFEIRKRGLDNLIGRGYTENSYTQFDTKKEATEALKKIKLILKN